jgi:hypothetical protein
MVLEIFVLVKKKEKNVLTVFLIVCRDTDSLQDSVTNLCSEARQASGFISYHLWRLSSCSSIQVRSNQ